MFIEVVRSIKMTLILAALLCGIYPLGVWVVGQVVFPAKANGGIIYRDGKAIGAELIGQGFSKPEYFQGRPSAAGSGYDAASSSGSNLGPTNKKLADRVNADVDRILKENPGLSKGQVPVEMATTSGSGLDPHISPEAASVQVQRVAQARGMSVEEVKNLVATHLNGPQWGIFGESSVNVLALNIELDQMRERKK